MSSPEKQTLTMGRRAFSASVVAGAIALFSLSFLATIVRYLWPAGEKAEGKVVEIARAGEVALGAAKEKWLFEGFPAILINFPEGYKAFAVKCTHLGCTAAWRPEGWKPIGFANPVLFCPCHDGVFDPKTGKVLAGPPPAALPEIQVEERGGKIVATGWKDQAYVKTLDVYRK